ncbi:MAG TPA: hypothetical protein VFN42_04260 [Acetobacteraceae bacterium]|nr:hypothetical protein [Acetobacteraceae bacterium]
MARAKPIAGVAKRQHSLVWLQGLGCGAVVTLAPGFAALLGILLAPGLVALLFDREAGRPMARCVLLTGMAACIAPVEMLWSNGQTVAAALGLLGDFQVMGTAWSASAAGWLLAELAPLGSRLVLEALARSRAARLRAQRQVLIESWGFGDGGD